jgi:GDPmannose 4,6-dehydratase
MRILITGAAGQDGTILAGMAAREGHDLVGLVKPGTDVATLVRYAPDLRVIECDLCDATTLGSVVREEAPDRIFNLGGISSIMESVNNPELTHEVNVVAVEVIIDAMRDLRRRGTANPRLVAAASGTIFEGVDRSPQTEVSEISPSTPYARSKAEVTRMLADVRSREGIFVASAILYNHESPLRGPGFVTRKITMAVARIAAGQQDVLELGDIEVARDWGWAPDYVTGMRLMLESDEPRDYLLATGISHRLTFFIDRAFAAAGIRDWRKHVVSTSDNKRNVDTNLLVGDSRAAYRELGWRHTVDFDSMAAIMVGHDMALLDDPMALWAIP